MTALVQKIENLPVSAFDFDQHKIDLLKNTVCKGASNDELELFLHVCRRTGLDPFMKQIYSIPRGGQRTIQTSIDGLRLIAERTGKYSPGKESTYHYDEKGNLISSTAFVKKMTPDGTWHEISASAIFNEFCPGNNTFWKKMPHVMLSKCAEASALRKAFPAEMSGVYAQEEMDQAGNNVIETKVEEKICPGDVTVMTAEFFSQFPEEEHELIQEYLNKYCKHWKKEIWEAFEDYKDKEEFLKIFNKWKKQHKINS